VSGCRRATYEALWKFLRAAAAEYAAPPPPRHALVAPIATSVALEPRKTSRRAGEAGESPELIMAGGRVNTNASTSFLSDQVFIEPRVATF
jgi:hypothetical protein